MLSSHNSYHLAPGAAINQLLSSPLAQSMLQPELFLPQAWQYSHRSLTQQLDEGVRSLELDVHADPEGGRYAQSAGLRLAGQSGVLDVPELREPGFKVFHLPDFDFNSTCFLLTDCLAEVRRWSERNPGHLPVVIFVETKQPGDVAAALGPDAVATIEAMLAASLLPGPDSLTPSLELNASGLAALEDEIRSVFDGASLLTPDNVAALLPGAGAVGLAEHLLVPPSNASCPWPDLDVMRGKVLFALTFGGEEQAAVYEELHPPGSPGALFWPVSSSGFDAPWPAVFYNSALSLGPEEAKAAGAPPGGLPANISAYIDEWVEESNQRAGEGYIVRARADQDTSKPPLCVPIGPGCCNLLKV
ncbi:hypothetical protein COHA_005179 [Chlorella ohadii]|uniref:Uncharacterized protein n=1 Tax=Chlorella ohadii TaxID=2649997 RepID=A0AAD5DVP3_9CHLO|nr:hypothetical protein COHA_005179 [Chlorella ohadii]